MNRKTDATAQTGFILLEWLIVLLLLALLSVAGIRHVQLLLTRRQLVENAYRVREFLFQLRTEALLLHRTWLLESEGVTGHTRLVARNPATGRVRRAPIDWRVVQLAAISAGPPGFYSQRQGAVAGHLLLQNAAGEIRIVISARSRIRLCAARPLTGVLPPCV